MLSGFELYPRWVPLFSLRKALIFQTFAEVYYSVFVKRSSFKSLLNLRKAYIFRELPDGLLSICVTESLKFYLGLRLHIFQHGSSLSLENVCDSWCKHHTRLFSSAAVVPQNKFTDLCSSAAVVPQSKSAEM